MALLKYLPHAFVMVLVFPKKTLHFTIIECSDLSVIVNCFACIHILRQFNRPPGAGGWDMECNKIVGGSHSH